MAVTKAQAIAELQRRRDAKLGFTGIGNDISKSLSTIVPSAVNAVESIPEGINNVGDYATTTNPVSTLANLGAGGVETAAQVLSSPQVLMRWLAQKFPEFGKRMAASNPDGSFNDPTFYEQLQQFENAHGLAPQSPQEASVRSAGGLMFGGKGLSVLPNALARTAAVTAQQTGAGGDPLHAALLSMLMEGMNKTLGGKQKVPDQSAIPPSGGSTGGTPPIPQPTLPTASVGAGFNVQSLLPGLNVSLGGLDNVANAVSGAVDKVKQIPQAAVDVSKKIPEFAGTALSSALENVADQSTRLPVIGGAAQPTIGAIASYLKHISVPPEELAQRNLFGNIKSKDIPKMEERDAAGKRLGLEYLTPSELKDSPFESVKQATVGRTTPGMELLYDKGLAREGSEEAAINKLFDLIHTDELEPVKKAAYEQTMKNSLPDEFIQEQSQNPAIQKAMKTVENNTGFKQLLLNEYGISPDKIPKNSFMYWDMVKRALKNTEDKLSGQRANTEASAYSTTRNNMVKKMDEIEPQYKIARNIAERGFIKKDLQDVFDKKAKNFNNFHSGFLNSDEKYTDLLDKLDAFPKAKQQLQDIKLFAGKMIPNNPTTRAAAALKRTGMSDPRNQLDAKKRDLDERFGQEHDVAAVNLMTNPDLMTVLKKYLAKKGK